jgi:hypothetical protein
MATRYTLSTGYAYRWGDSSDPEIVILPPDAEHASGIADVYESTARRGFVDGSPVVWVDTPAGTFAQMAHMVAAESLDE